MRTIRSRAVKPDQLRLINQLLNLICNAPVPQTVHLVNKAYIEISQVAGRWTKCSVGTSRFFIGEYESISYEAKNGTLSVFILVNQLLSFVL